HPGGFHMIAAGGAFRVHRTQFLQRSRETSLWCFNRTAPHPDFTVPPRNTQGLLQPDASSRRRWPTLHSGAAVARSPWSLDARHRECALPTETVAVLGPVRVEPFPPGPPEPAVDPRDRDESGPIGER